MFDYSELTSYFSQVSDNTGKDGKLIIALVGAGGKTTTMYALGDYFKARGKRVLLTTTTKIFPPQKEQVDACLIGVDLKEIEIDPGTTLLVGLEKVADGKIGGYEAEQLGSISRRSYDVVIYEADGSKRKPIKAPADHEPVIAEGTTHVIGLVGLDALGKSATALYVHRLERFLDVTGIHMGDAVTPDAVVNLVKHRCGLFKGTSPAMKRVCLFTKNDTAETQRYSNVLKRKLEGWDGRVFVI